MQLHAPTFLPIVGASRPSFVAGMQTNDEEAIYIHMVDGIYDIQSYDDSVTHSRLTKDACEVFLAKLNKLSGTRNRVTNILALVFLIYGIIVVGLFIYLVVSLDSGLIYVIVGYSVLIFGGALGFCYFIHKYRSNIAPFQEIVDAENEAICNPKGLHWSLGDGLKYLQLNLKYENASATFPTILLSSVQASGQVQVAAQLTTKQNNFLRPYIPPNDDSSEEICHSQRN